jgi:hypothetical protein
VVGGAPGASVDVGAVDEAVVGVPVVDDVAATTAVVVGPDGLPVQAESTSTGPSSQSGGVIRRIFEP